MIFKTNSGFGELESLDRFQDRNYIDSADDGLGKFREFHNYYGRAISLSREVDALRGEPLAADLVRLEAGIANALRGALEDGAYHYQWNLLPPWKRTTDRWRALANAQQNAWDRAQQYVNEIGPAIERVKAAIDDRARRTADAERAIEAARNAELHAKETASKSAAIIESAKASSAQAEADKIIAQAMAIAGKAKAEALILAAEAQKKVKQLTQAVIFGIPVTNVIAVVGLGGAAAWFYSRKK